MSQENVEISKRVFELLGRENPSVAAPGHRVLIAGGGVAGLEALLGLSHLARGLAQTTLLAPAETFVYRPLLVAEPFGVGHAAELDLSEVASRATRHGRSPPASSPCSPPPSGRKETFRWWNLLW